MSPEYRRETFRFNRSKGKADRDQLQRSHRQPPRHGPVRVRLHEAGRASACLATRGRGGSGRRKRVARTSFSLFRRGPDPARIRAFCFAAAIAPHRRFKAVHRSLTTCRGAAPVLAGCQPARQEAVAARSSARVRPTSVVPNQHRRPRPGHGPAEMCTGSRPRVQRANPAGLACRSRMDTTEVDFINRFEPLDFR